MWISLPLIALTFVPESFAIMQSGDQTEAQYRTSAITISIIAYGLFNCFAWAIGRWAARASARLDASEERRKADIAAERLQAEQAVAEERLRLARELHDIVAHAVTIMIIHSATASRLIHRDPGAAEEALDIVNLAGRQAVDELHRMLGLLRAVGSSAGLDGDLPTLSDLPALVERTRAGGLKVELTESGQPTSLDPSVQLAGYRVVQETLTNALKYSGVGSRTTVDLGWTDEKLIITVITGGDQPDALEDRCARSLLAGSSAETPKPPPSVGPAVSCRCRSNRSAQPPRSDARSSAAGACGRRWRP
jgi:signal transduction histidine kinase